MDIDEVWTDLEPGDLPGDLEAIGRDSMEYARQLVQIVRGRLWVPSLKTLEQAGVVTQPGAGELPGELRAAPDPAPDDFPSDLERIAREGSIDLALYVATHWHACDLYIPSPKSVRRIARDREICRLVGPGPMDEDEARRLAVRWDCAVNTIRRIARKADTTDE
jgi:hypothetical protein